MKDGGLTGADVADQSGVDTCVAGVRIDQVCFRAENFARPWSDAAAHCANLDLRLPTLAEAMSLALGNDLPDVDEAEDFWTDEYIGASTAWAVNDAGGRLGAGTATTAETVCVTTPTN